MKTTYHSNLGMADSSQVRNVSSKEEMCFRTLFVYPHVSFGPAQRSVETFEVCEDLFLCLHLILPDGRAGLTMFWSVSLSSTLSFLGTVTNSICHKPGSELAPRCSWDTQREAMCCLLKRGSLLSRTREAPIWIQTGVQDITVDFLLSLKVLNYFIA